MSARVLSTEELESLTRRANFQPARIAALCDCAPKQLQRDFKRRFRETPENWARRLRCRLAKDMIVLGSDNKTVVSELKFTDQAHLCHEFQYFYSAEVILNSVEI